MSNLYTSSAEDGLLQASAMEHRPLPRSFHMTNGISHNPEKVYVVNLGSQKMSFYYLVRNVIGFELKLHGSYD